MIRWLRAVLPPWWTVLAAVFCYLGLEFFCLGSEWRLGVPFYSIVEGRIFVIEMAFFVVLYAIYRVFAFHPALRPGYYHWLRGTPWTSRKRLPLGPVHLVLQDVLILGVAVGLCWPRCGTESLAVLQVFLAAYVIVLGFSHVLTGQKAWAYAVGVGLGFMVLFALSPLFFVAAGITYAVAILGLRASLAHFPWDNVPQLQVLKQSFKSNARSKYKGMLGWPFERLGPGFSFDNPFTLGDSLLTGLLAGWLLFVAGYQINTYDVKKSNEMILMVSSFFLAGGAIMRIACYCDGYVSPLSLWGRLAHGRLIIPGYDQVYLAPLVAVLAFVAMATLPLWSGIPGLIAIPIGLTMTWWTLFGMGPSLNAWRLTGNHRIVKGLMTNAGQQNR
jgi:hypothetical protein